LNTSFNGPKEPIVESPYDAIRTFIETGWVHVVINNFLISFNFNIKQTDFIAYKNIILY
jgi:predicted NodU family carbamoyl transferase